MAREHRRTIGIRHPTELHKHDIEPASVPSSTGIALTPDLNTCLLLAHSQSHGRDDFALWHTLGKSLNEFGEFALSEQCLVRAVEREPDNPIALRSLGLALWRSGKIAEGLGYYDLGRRRIREFEKILRHYPQPEWTGQDLSGRDVLLWGEQGLGDQIMQARCLPEIVRKARSVTVECDPRLHSLLKRSFPQVQLKTQYTDLLPELISGS